MGPTTTPGPRQRRRAARLSAAAGVETGQGFFCFPPVPPPVSATPDGVQKRGLKRWKMVTHRGATSEKARA